ncbi:MAG: hypothetical protein EBZ60_04090, partial [Betaproteobacteria bacterium]|nr:hypothetical protein [Betaproteobacteria bacterium]
MASFGSKFGGVANSGQWLPVAGVQGMTTIAGLILIYFVWLAIGLVWRSQTVRGPWFFLFRAFFPNWQFYHQVGPVPHLYVRCQAPDQGWSDWQWVYPRYPRRLWHLFHNPSGNLALAGQNLVEHLSSDIKDLGEGQNAAPLVSYQLVCRLAAQAVR